MTVVCTIPTRDFASLSKPKSIVATCRSCNYVMCDAFKNTVSVLLGGVFKADLLQKYKKGIR